MQEDTDMEFKFKDERESSTQENQDDSELLFKVKEKAKSFFQAKQFKEAYQVYAEAMNLTQFKDEIATLHNNMAQCAINTQQYEKALTHCHKSLKHVQTDLPMLVRIKLKYRLATCLLKLRDYKKCGEVVRNLKTYCNLEQELGLSKTCVLMWEEAGKLQNENIDGKYTCKDLFQDKGEVAPFCNKKLKLEIVQQGRSVFGQNITKGELLVAGPALATGNSAQHLVQQLRQKISEMPLSTTLQLQYLKGGSHQNTIPNMDVYSAPLTQFVIQNSDKKFAQISDEALTDIVTSNCFTGQKHCLFLVPSFFNHSCRPTCVVSYFRPDSSVIFIKSLYDISEKQELTVTYVDPLMTLPERQNILQEKWGFICTCERCQEEQEYDLKWRLTFKELQILTMPENLIAEADQLQDNLDLIFQKIDQLQGLVTSQKQFNPYYASIILTLMQIFNSVKLKFPRDMMVLNFQKLQNLTIGYLPRFVKDYPHLLSKYYDLCYEFKASFEQRKGDELSVYNELDSAGEERNFQEWEQLYQIIYPKDWYESSYVFNRKIKDVYENRFNLQE